MPPRDDGGNTLEPAALDRLWDAMNRQITPVGGHTGLATLVAAQTIDSLNERDDAPHLASTDIDRLWASIAATALPDAAPVTEMGAAAASRGLHVRSGTRTAVELARTLARQIAIGALAGFLVGFVVIGGGLRVLMRLAALLSEQSTSPMVTENGNVVGDITLDGTLALLFFTGAIFGMMGGIVVMAIRPWLPSSGWPRLLLSGAIGFAVAGPAVLEAGENNDYQRFGILGLNICLFTLVPFFFGIAVLPVIDWMDGKISLRLPGLSRGWTDALKSVAMLLLCLPALLLIPAIVGTPPIGLLLALPVLRLLGPIWLRHAPTREQRRKRERWEIGLARLMLVTPCLVGLLLMAQAIERLAG